MPLDELRRRLREAVGIRLIAEVPLGAFLSGGVDSSSVVAMMADISQDAVNMSIAFGRRNTTGGDTPRQSRTNSVVVTVLGPWTRTTIHWSICYPDSTTSRLPTARRCHLQGLRTGAKNVTVVLSGDGGDESFAGYRRYAEHLKDLSAKGGMPAVLRRLLGAVGGCTRYTAVAGILRRRQGLISMGQDPVASFCDTNAVMKRDMRMALYSDIFAATCRVTRRWRCCVDMPPRRPDR